MSNKSYINAQNGRVDPNMFNVPPPITEPGLTFLNTAQPPPSAVEPVFSVPPPSAADSVFPVPPPQVTVLSPCLKPFTALPPSSLSVLPPVLTGPLVDVAQPPPDVAHPPPNAAHPPLNVTHLPPIGHPLAFLPLSVPIQPSSANLQRCSVAFPNQPPPPIPDFTRPPPPKRIKCDTAIKYEPTTNQYIDNDLKQQAHYAQNTNEEYEPNGAHFTTGNQCYHNQYSDGHSYTPNVPTIVPHYMCDSPNSSSYRKVSHSSSVPDIAPCITLRDFSKDRNNSRDQSHWSDDERYRSTSLRRDKVDCYDSSSRRSGRDYTSERYEGTRETSRESIKRIEYMDSNKSVQKSDERLSAHRAYDHRREREVEEKRARYYKDKEREAQKRMDGEDRYRRHPEQREREEHSRRHNEERHRQHLESRTERDGDRSRRYIEDRRRTSHTGERLREPKEIRFREPEERRMREKEERLLEPVRKRLGDPDQRRSLTVDRHGRGSSHAESSRDFRDYDCRSAVSDREASVSSRNSRAQRHSPESIPSQRSTSRHTTRRTLSEQRTMTDRDKILETYRKNYCHTSEQIMERLENLAKENSEEDEEAWYRSSPAELYYKVLDCNGLVEHSTKGMKLSEVFMEKLIESARKARPEVDELCPSVQKPKMHKHKHPEESSSSGSEPENEDECIQNELQRKLKHPRRLHPEIWYNETGEMNDRPLCRCSARAKRLGIRHGVFAGEKQFPRCITTQNNTDKLYHYRITVSPPTNFLIKTPTIISHDEHEFLFSGFSMFSHYKLATLPVCKVIRFNIEYTILYVEEQAPQNYTIQELDLFEEYLFKEILELMDLDLGKSTEDKCSQFHFLPRFVRNLGEGGCEVLSMCEVLKYLLNEYQPLVPKEDLPKIHKMDHYRWQKFVDRIKGIIVTCPGKKPCSVRVDQLDRKPPDNYDLKGGSVESSFYPEIVHFGIRPPQLCYAGIPQYQKAWRKYVKFRHLIANMAKPTFQDRQRLQAKEAKLQEMRMQSKMKRDVTVAVSCEGFYTTGLMCDVVQHAMLIPVLVRHLRFHNSLNSLEESINYKFHNRSLLQLALTHPSFRDNFGTNPDHARNSLTNCGIRQPEYGDRQIHYMNTRKRGINTLIEIMSRFGKKTETESAIGHNERLEFLGDAVVEFLSTVHLFLMFPGLAEGGLATYRAAIVQNQHLALLAKKIGLEQYMLYTHGSDLCQDLELRHAMANCFEALIAALYLDGDIEVANRVFSLSLWLDESSLMEVWMRQRSHPLQEQEPLGDRKYIKNFDFLQKLTKFEESIGIQFKHIRLLARAFTDRSVGFTHLTLGSNQRLEFLGDTVLQLVVSDRLYRYFPEHHEGHLSLLRSSLVNNRTQSVVCDDLDMTRYAVYHNPKAAPSTKDKADLLEAFLGALFLDKGIEYCTAFCNACLFPRLQEFIMNQDWNDPKSKLQQCCLTLRTMEGGEPDVPIYKVIECLGPTNTRVYHVAVYFRGSRLAANTGHSIQEAEMNAAKTALASSHELFPQLDHQKRIIAKSVSSHTPGRAKSNKPTTSSERNKEEKQCIQRLKKKMESNLKDRVPKAYKLGQNAYSDESSIASSESEVESEEGSDKEDSGHISGDSSTGNDPQ